MLLSKNGVTKGYIGLQKVLKRLHFGVTKVLKGSQKFSKGYTVLGEQKKNVYDNQVVKL